MHSFNFILEIYDRKLSKQLSSITSISRDHISQHLWKWRRRTCMLQLETKLLSNFRIMILKVLLTEFWIVPKWVKKKQKWNIFSLIKKETLSSSRSGLFTKAGILPLHSQDSFTDFWKQNRKVVNCRQRCVIFSQKQKPRKFISRKHSLKEILEDVLQAEKKLSQMESQRGRKKWRNNKQKKC